MGSTERELDKGTSRDQSYAGFERPRQPVRVPSFDLGPGGKLIFKDGTTNIKRGDTIKGTGKKARNSGKRG